MSKQTKMTKEERDDMAALTKLFDNEEAVTPLHAIDNNLVQNMHKVIRWQASLLKQADLAIIKVLMRIKTDAEVQYKIGAGSQTYEDVTAAHAAIVNLNVDEVRDYTIPNSAAVHRGNEEEAAND